MKPSIKQITEMAESVLGSEVPVLSNIKMGNTGYLDQLIDEDMPHNVMKGVDELGRAFLAVKLQTDSPHLTKTFASKNGVIVETFFKRYIDDDEQVVVSGTAGVSLICFSAFKEEEMDLLKKVLEGKTCKNLCDRPKTVWLAK